MKFQLLGAILFGLLVSLGCEIPPGKNALMDKWRQNRSRYDSIVAKCNGLRNVSLLNLDSADASLSLDHKAWIHRDGSFRVTFVMAKWGIDNSYGIVFQDPETPLPEDDSVLEKWAKVTKLDTGWYFVEGT